MKTLLQLARLTYLILCNGRFPKKGSDYKQMRRDGLADLNQFHPITPQKNAGISSFKKWIFKSHLLKHLAGEVSFVKNALKTEARHLTVQHLRLSYIRNPKAASTSLSYAMLQARYPEIRQHSLTAEKINFLADVNLKKEIGPDEKTGTFFTVVRNPFARIVSVYRDFFEKSSSHFIYNNYLFGILKKELSFNEFVHILLVIPDFLKDQHLKPQYTFMKFYRKKEIEVNILKLEDHPGIRSFLLNFNLTLPYINQQESTYDYRSYYDPDLVDKVYKLYEQDVLLFGYQQAYQDLKNSALK